MAMMIMMMPFLVLAKSSAARFSRGLKPLPRRGSTPAGSAVTNSICDSATEAEIWRDNEDLEQIFDVKRCCGKRVTSSAGLACVAILTACSTLLCLEPV